MDTVEPRNSKRAPARTVARSTTPADPRQESPTGGTPRPKNGASSTKRRNGSGTTKSPAPKKTPAAKAPVPESTVGSDDDSGAQLLAVALVEDVESIEEHPAASNGNGSTHGNGNGSSRGTGTLDTYEPEAHDVEVVPEGPFEIPTIVPAEPIEEATTEPGETDGTGGLPSMRRSRRQPRALRAPVVVPRRRRPRVRRVTRVVRHVDTWSVFKIALIFNLFLYAVCLVAGVLLWQVASNTGTVDNIERWFESFGWETFELKGGEIYHNGWIAGLFVIVGLTGLAVLAATLFNLITDLVGGIRVSVLEEEVVAREDRGLGWRPSRRQRRTIVDTQTHEVYTEPVFVPVTGETGDLARPDLDTVEQTAADGGPAPEAG